MLFEDFVDLCHAEFVEFNNCGLGTVCRGQFFIDISAYPDILFL